MSGLGEKWAGALAMALLLAMAPAGAQADDGVQPCIDRAVSACFDVCTDPDTLQACIQGCATGANMNLPNCDDQCDGDPTCLARCRSLVATAQACVGATQKVEVVRGAVVLNRATGVWQQTLKFTNSTALETLRNLVLVVDELPAGWTVSNAEGSTQGLLPSGRPFRNLADSLAPGASVTLVLHFARTGTPSFRYTPLVYTTTLR